MASISANPKDPKAPELKHRHPPPPPPPPRTVEVSDYNHPYGYISARTIGDDDVGFFALGPDGAPLGGVTLERPEPDVPYITAKGTVGVTESVSTLTGAELGPGMNPEYTYIDASLGHIIFGEPPIVRSRDEPKKKG